MTTIHGDKKSDIELRHYESGLVDAGPQTQEDQAAAAIGQQATGFEELGPLQTVKSFKAATVYAMMATFAAACDGYQASVPM